VLLTCRTEQIITLKELIIDGANLKFVPSDGGKKMEILGPVNLREEVLRRIDLHQRDFLSQQNLEDSLGSLADARTADIEDQILESFPSSALPEDFEWRKFTVIAEKHLLNWTKILKNKVIENSIQISDHEKESISTWFDLWQLGRLKEELMIKLDLERNRHGENKDPRCPIDVLIGGDRQLLDLVGYDIMNLYDPCVIERIWKAEITSDYSFFEALGNALKTYATGPTKNNIQAESRFYLVTAVLCEMQRLGFVNLISKNVEVAENEWEFARHVIRYFLSDCPGLIAKRYFQKKEFQEKFASEFRKHKDSESPLVTYRYENSSPRFRLRQWLHLK
jgi:hypothetical protein